MSAAAPAAVSIASTSINPEFRRVFSTLAAAAPGACLVGGAVRDLLTGRVPTDLDVVTPSDARAAAEAAGRALSAAVFALDEARGHYRVTLLESGDIRTIDVSAFADLEADLRRRDFTVNALAAPILADGSLGKVTDPTGGLQDLEDGVLRMVSEAGLREDPLRLLRAARLAHELELEIEPQTEQAVRELAFLLSTAAPERQRDELVRMLASGRAARAVRLLDALTLLQELLPEITAARGVGQPFEHHYWDVFDHSVEALAALDEMLMPAAEPERWLARTFREQLAGFELDAYLNERVGGQSRAVLLKLAALLHDVAKPETKTQEAGGRVRFFGHPERGAETAARICRRLRFGSRETQFVALLVEEHLRPAQLSQGDLPTKRAVYRFFRDLGEAAPACLFLSLADAAAARGPRLQPDRWAGHVAYIARVLQQGLARDDGVARPRRLVDGGALMAALDLGPGPLIGRLLDAIDEAHATGEITTQEQAIALARELIASQPAPSPQATRGLGEPESSLPAGDPAAAPGVQPEESVVSRAAGPRADSEPDGTRGLSPASQMLWQALHDRALSAEFSRGERIDGLVVDFFCPEAGLAVEVDEPAADGRRDDERFERLESLGITVLRFHSEDVLNHPDRVVRLIRVALEDALADPDGRGSQDRHSHE
jgi:tRNA nucleotidyltransferase/poly(A) polymerase/very-short-patch-repair endonuclease